jgi:predicted GNAT family N-acyltransferase
MEVRIINHEATRPLRHLVLWPHLQNESACVLDTDMLPDAIHLGVFHEQQLISIGSLFPQISPRLSEQSQFRLRAMATSPDFRKKNAGKMLVQFALAMLQSRGAQVLWCDARLHAVGFYQSLGFSLLPEIYEVKNIGPHQFMWIELHQVNS